MVIEPRGQRTKPSPEYRNSSEPAFSAALEFFCGPPPRTEPWFRDDSGRPATRPDDFATALPLRSLAHDDQASAPQANRTTVPPAKPRSGSYTTRAGRAEPNQAALKSGDTSQPSATGKRPRPPLKPVSVMCRPPSAELLAAKRQRQLERTAAKGATAAAPGSALGRSSSSTEETACAKGGDAKGVDDGRPSDDECVGEALTLAAVSKPGDGAARSRRAAVYGIFHPDKYLAGEECIDYQGNFITRSKFERLGGSLMAKWYRSIRVVPTDEPLGAWLSRRGLPVLKGNPRTRRQAPEAKKAARRDSCDASSETDTEPEGEDPLPAARRPGSSSAAAAPPPRPARKSRAARRDAAGHSPPSGGRTSGGGGGGGGRNVSVSLSCSSAAAAGTGTPGRVGNGSDNASGGLPSSLAWAMPACAATGAAATAVGSATTELDPKPSAEFHLGTDMLLGVGARYGSQVDCGMMPLAPAPPVPPPLANPFTACHAATASTTAGVPPGLAAVREGSVSDSAARCGLPAAAPGIMGSLMRPICTIGGGGGDTAAPRLTGQPQASTVSLGLDQPLPARKSSLGSGWATWGDAPCFPAGGAASTGGSVDGCGQLTLPCPLAARANGSGFNGLAPVASTGPGPGPGRQALAGLTYQLQGPPGAAPAGGAWSPALGNCANAGGRLGVERRSAGLSGGSNALVAAGATPGLMAVQTRGSSLNRIEAVKAALLGCAPGNLSSSGEGARVGALGLDGLPTSTASLPHLQQLQQQHQLDQQQHQLDQQQHQLDQQQRPLTLRPKAFAEGFEQRVARLLAPRGSLDATEGHQLWAEPMATHGSGSACADASLSGRDSGSLSAGAGGMWGPPTHLSLTMPNTATNSALGTRDLAMCCMPWQAAHSVVSQEGLAAGRGAEGAWRGPGAGPAGRLLSGGAGGGAFGAAARGYPLDTAAAAAVVACCAAWRTEGDLGL